MVHPFVGKIEYTPSFIADKEEVDTLIPIAISELFSLSVQTKELTIGDEKLEVPYFPLNNEVLWGATAMIINEFKELVNN